MAMVGRTRHQASSVRKTVLAESSPSCSSFWTALKTWYIKKRSLRSRAARGPPHLTAKAADRRHPALALSIRLKDVSCGCAVVVPFLLRQGSTFGSSMQALAIIDASAPRCVATIASWLLFKRPLPPVPSSLSFDLLVRNAPCRERLSASSGSLATIT